MLVLTLLLIGLVISLEPIPLTAFILILASKGGVRKGAGFIFGWLVSLAVVMAATVAVTGDKPPRPNTAPSTTGLAVKILAGAVLVLIAIRKWRRMGEPKPPKKTPKWQTGIDNMSPWFAMIVACLAQPWGLVAIGVATVTEAKLSSWQSYLALFLFCVFASGTYIAMEIYAGFRPDRTQAFLARNQGLDRHPHRPGNRRRLAAPRILADRREHLRHRHLTEPTVVESSATGGAVTSRCPSDSTSFDGVLWWLYSAHKCCLGRVAQPVEQRTRNA